MAISGLLYIHFDIKDIYEEVKRVFPEKDEDFIKEKLKEMFIDVDSELVEFFADYSCVHYLVGFYSDFAEDNRVFFKKEQIEMYKAIDKIFYESGIKKGVGIYINFINFN